MKADEHRWLVLLFQFSTGPGSARMKIWRRLQGIGAVSIKNSVYVLPWSEQSREDFSWLLQEMKSAGADGSILEARFLDGMSDQQVRELFRTARAADYADLLEEIQSCIAKLRLKGGPGDEASVEAAQRILVRTRKRLGDIEKIDFFAANGHDSVEAAVRELGNLIAGLSDAPATRRQALRRMKLEELKGKVWVTRSGVRVDRMASAWLIQRWIDPVAKFKFVDGAGDAAGNSEIRFDMFEAEFTHEGELCTFEVLVQMLGLTDSALQSIAEIVHDIDLKDGKFDRPETSGIASILSGIVSAGDDDLQRIERGNQLFDDLYRAFAGVAE